MFTLDMKIGTSYEVQANTLLKLVAEVGGYLGMTLGISLLDLKVMVPIFWRFFQQKVLILYTKVKFAKRSGENNC